MIEDDYDGEFRYDRRPVGALQALAPDQVVYAGTASKSLAPGVRLGWLVVPGTCSSPVLAARAHGDWPSALDQLTLAELIESGGYDRHVRRMRLVYRRRRDRLLVAVPRVTGIDAGLHAVVELDEEEAVVVERGRRHDLLVEGLDTYRFGPQLSRTGTRRRLRDAARARLGRRTRAAPRGARYLSSTEAPASSSCALIWSASSWFTPSLTGFGAESTRSLASLRPRPVTARTTLITWIF